MNQEDWFEKLKNNHAFISLVPLETICEYVLWMCALLRSNVGLGALFSSRG